MVFLMACHAPSDDGVDDDDSAVQATTVKIEAAPPFSLDIDGQTFFLPPGPVKPDDVPDHLLDAMERGKELLESVRMEKGKCKGAGLEWQKCLGDYLLVAVDAGGILQQIEAYESSPSNPPHFSVKCEIKGACENGGVNPPFLVSSPPGWTVVAIRTVVKGSPDGVVYTPYSSALNVPELRQSGLEYLRLVTLAAYYDLRSKEIPSVHVDGAMVTEIAGIDHQITLILTEQVGDKGFIEADDAGRVALMNRVFTIIGMNRSRSYLYQRSRAKAGGMSQIIPSTYKGLRKNYPDAHMLADATIGRTDHVSAVRAMFLHADEEWREFKKSPDLVRKMRKDPAFNRAVLAAGYNASSRTVTNSYIACGENWRSDKCNLLPGETRRYVTKYEWIHRILFDEFFRLEVGRRISR